MLSFIVAVLAAIAAGTGCAFSLYYQRFWLSFAFAALYLYAVWEESAFALLLTHH